MPFSIQSLVPIAQIAMATDYGKEGYVLSNILRDFKKHTSSKIVEEIENNLHESRRIWMLNLFSEAAKRNVRNTSYQFWRQDSKPIELSTNKMIEQRLD